MKFNNFFNNLIINFQIDINLCINKKKIIIIKIFKLFLNIKVLL